MNKIVQECDKLLAKLYEDGFRDSYLGRDRYGPPWHHTKESEAYNRGYDDGKKAAKEKPHAE